MSCVMPRPTGQKQGEGGVGSDALPAAAAVAAPAVATPAEEITAIKARLAELCIKKKPTKAERAVIAKTRRELKAAVNAPVSGGCDPTESLPDELIVLIMLMLPFATLWSGVCKRVCRRWERLMESPLIVRRKREGRWAAYEEGAIKPMVLEGHTDPVMAMGVGIDGNVYSGSMDKTIGVWSGESGAHLQTLQGHTSVVSAFVVGMEGRFYSGSYDITIRV